MPQLTNYYKDTDMFLSVPHLVSDAINTTTRNKGDKC